MSRAKLCIDLTSLLHKCKKKDSERPARKKRILKISGLDFAKALVGKWQVKQKMLWATMRRNWHLTVKKWHFFSSTCVQFETFEFWHQWCAWSQIQKSKVEIYACLNYQKWSIKVLARRIDRFVKTSTWYYWDVIRLQTLQKRWEGLKKNSPFLTLSLICNISKQCSAQSFQKRSSLHILFPSLIA